MIKIIKLKSVEDWTTWKFQIKVMMIANESFGVTNGTVTKPELPNQNANAEIRAAYQKDLKQWLKLDGSSKIDCVTRIGAIAAAHNGLRKCAPDVEQAAINLRR